MKCFILINITLTVIVDVTKLKNIQIWQKQILFVE